MNHAKARTHSRLRSRTLLRTSAPSRIADATPSVVPDAVQSVVPATAPVVVQSAAPVLDVPGRSTCSVSGAVQEPHSESLLPSVPGTPAQAVSDTVTKALPDASATRGPNRSPGCGSEFRFIAHCQRVLGCYSCANLAWRRERICKGRRCSRNRTPFQPTRLTRRRHRPARTGWQRSPAFPAQQPISSLH